MSEKIFNILAGVALLMTIDPVKAGVLSSIVTTLEQMVLTKASYDCTCIQTWLGVSYYQMDDKIEPDADDVSLVLYTKDESEPTYFKLSDSLDLLINSPKFNVNQPITIFIHGYYNTQNSTVVKEMTAALLKRGGTNVFMLHPGPLISGVYFRATTNVLFIGELLGWWLAECFKRGLDKIHLIGHSLGAHISGLAGKTFQGLINGKKISRISGLDPAGPCFYSTPNSHKLYSTDAAFVDVVHSDAGVLGINQALGHVDIYPNNGRNQPDALLIPECHRRAWRTYIESINFPKNFPAVKCANWVTFLSGACLSSPTVFMGYDLPSTTSGIYYFRTNGESPFGMGDKGARPDDNPIKAFNAWWTAWLFG